MATEQPVTEPDYVEPEALVDPCPTCRQRVADCQSGLYEKVFTPSHHLHFMRSGSCTLSPSCQTELRTRSPDRCSGTGTVVFARRPAQFRELVLPELSHEAKSLYEHYSIPGVATRNRNVVWWVVPGELLLAREHAHAQRVESVIRRVGYVRKDGVGTSRGKCRQCDGEIIWGDSDSGKRVPLEPATMQESGREGFFVGSVHWDHCEKVRDGKERKRRDRARQGEKD